MKVIKNKKAFMSLSVKIIISVVIGGLLLGGTYAIVNNVVVPKMVEKSERTLIESEDEASVFQGYIIS